jgi:hypothetical protein
MATRNAGLLLSNAAAPAAGMQNASVIQWYGGNLRVSAQGVFDGATVDIMVCTRLPTGGDRADYLDPTKFTDADWSSLGSTSEPNMLNYGNVNPCALAVKVTNPGANTRIKVGTA